MPGAGEEPGGKQQAALAAVSNYLGGTADHLYHLDQRRTDDHRDH